MVYIDSAQNQTFKKLLSLTTAKGLKKAGLFLLSGEKLIREFLRQPNLKIHFEIVPPAGTPLGLPLHMQNKDFKALQFSSQLFAQLDVLGTHFNILVLEQPAIAVLTADALTSYVPQGIELVAPIGDPGNLGALLRSCEAFAVPQVILTREAAHPFLPKAVKASAGSVLRLSLRHGPALKEFPANCLALDSAGTPIDQFDWPECGLLVVGEEGPGFGAGQAQSSFTRRIRIPTAGVESLNVVVAASIAMAWRLRQDS